MLKRTALDLFCGMGGLSIGAELAGFEVLGGIDNDAVALGSYARTFRGKIALHADLLNESPEQVLRRAGTRRGDVDLLIGGPPCQPFSVYNHSRSSLDPRAKLFVKFLHYVTTLLPRMVVVENVPGLLSIADGFLWAHLVRSLRGRGYISAFRVLDASLLGVPQRRRRLVLIGSRESQDIVTILDHLGETRLPRVTVSAAFGDLPIAVGDGISYRRKPSNAFQRLMRARAGAQVHEHRGMSLGQKNLKRIAHVPPGGNWRNIPRRLLPPGMQRARPEDHTTRYGRLHRMRPSFTLLTKCDPHWGCFIHPDSDRVITIREAARLQSIPDHVRPSGTLTEQYRMIGNAVPPLLAREVLEMLQ